MNKTRAISLTVLMGLLCTVARSADVPKPAAPATRKVKTLAGARAKGLTWLTAHQAKDGSWGKQYTVAVTSFACLAYLAASDEPFRGDDGKALVRGLKFLLSMQKKGVFPNQGHSWIHGQGFAALAMSEALGRSMFAKAKPDLDAKKLRAAVRLAAAVIAANQSNSGGWWYTRGSKRQHEGSTTVTAVQALVSAANYGIEIDRDVLKKGFVYLKKCQNRDGGFDYQLDNSPNTKSMREGTAADVATLGLMRKFDYAVMMKGYKFLLKIGPQTISKERFPYYGHFYGCMGMRLLGQEFKSFRAKTDGYIAAAQKDILSWQDARGAWPIRGWVKVNGGGEGPAYATAFATLILGAGEGHLSICNRKPPVLPALLPERRQPRAGLRTPGGIAVAVDHAL